MRTISLPETMFLAEDYEALLNKFIEFSNSKNITELDLVCGEFSKDLLGKRLLNDCSSKFKINLYINELPSKSNQWLAAIGGGKILDKAKYFAAQNKINFISIPTLISHDGICSPVAVIDGKSLGAVMPSALFVPLYIIRSSPIKQLHAGVGDLISNFSAIEDWKLAAKYKQSQIDDFAMMLSRRAVMNVVQMLDQSDLEVWQDISFIKSLVESLVLSGIAMSITGNSRPCSGAEHLISHAIDAKYGAGKIAMHGIQVMVATLYLEALRGDNFDYIDHLYLDTKDFCHPERSEGSFSIKYSKLKTVLAKHNLPISFEDLKIQGIEDIISKAPLMRPDRFTILNLI
ncbi:MAG: iron-containing alcohol dehydrogenase [Candidatus Caenarcaniphilales bacterium]|jgi:glycerol dehydrogenase-like iron-containing ADH family enzyme|nr:iron-containing alcohol dehydrogenase [Candidatus Caenarcaniphilales bacterium]